jgi:exopolysaccharide production protein ExoQ
MRVLMQHDAPRRRTLERFANWPTICALVLFVASDYKLRVRPNDQSIAGRSDPFVLLEVGLYALVALFLVTHFVGPPRIRRVSTPVFLATAWVVVMVVSVTYSPYPVLAAIRAAELVIVLSLARALARHGDRTQLHHLAHWFIVLVAGSVVFGILFPMPRFPRQQDRFTWLRLHPVQAGIFVGVATVLAVLYLLAGSAARPGPVWPRWVYALLLLLVGGGLIGTNTRGATLGAGAAVLLIALATRSGRRKLDAAVLLGVGGLAVTLASSAQIAAFFARGEDARRLATLNSRTTLWSEAWVFIREQPLYGWGLGASRGLFLESIGLGGAHNAVINTLVDTGIVGCALWLAIVISVTILAIRVRPASVGARWDRALILGVLIFLVVDGFFTEAPAAAANVASTWLLILVGWLDVLRSDAAAARAAPVVPQRPNELPAAVPLLRRSYSRRQP